MPHSLGALIVLNSVGWVLVHLSVSIYALKLPLTRFHPQSFLFRECAFEKKGAIYTRFFLIKAWKRRLPDGAKWLGMGDPKTLRSKHPDVLKRYRDETLRSEWAHWMTLLATPLFYLFNPPWASVFITLYALVSNAPCIITQRYNRIKIQQILDRHNLG